jgi:hypothetical protein
MPKIIQGEIEIQDTRDEVYAEFIKRVMEAAVANAEAA